LVGLEAKPSLNGCVGIVRGFDSNTGRFEVEVLLPSSPSPLLPDTREKTKVLQVKEVNMKEVEQQFEDDGGMRATAIAAVEVEGTLGTVQHLSGSSSSSDGGERSDSNEERVGQYPSRRSGADSGGGGGGGDEESALQGQDLRTRRTCAFCCEAKGSKRCGGCEVVRYCSRTCAKAHWKQGHKDECGKARKQKPAKLGV